MINYTKKFLDELSHLPDYCMLYFTELDTRNFKESTKYVYAMDLKVFFEWLKDYNDIQHSSDVTFNMIDKLSADDLNLFISYLTKYEHEGVTYTNSASGKARKIGTLRSFFKFANGRKWITHNEMQFIQSPKRNEKEIIVLSEEEQQKMLLSAKTGDKKTERAKRFHEKTYLRDIAILTLFLGTGIRVSELVGINESDISFDEQKVLVTRKGGKVQFIYFGNEVKETLIEYIENERPSLLGYSDSSKVPFDTPLFVSLKHQRISVRMVQEIIGKYAKAVAGNIKITPHTLRKTYGSQLYYRYRDVYLTQEALGHSNPQTTIKYYTKFDEGRLEKMKDYNPIS